MSWQTVLGFEIHVELSTNSKMFCGCPADHFGKEPNTQTCPVCLGLPGALPVPNAKAIEWTVKMGLALGCKINLYSKFDRKNYFYPDLPKGYQISQYDLPFCYEGKVQITNPKTGVTKDIRITRVHLEEDTGKLQHVDGATLVDFNRSSVPLMEIVTEPDFDNADDGIEFLKEIQQIVRALGISSADMEKGSMRLEANVSVRPEGQTELPNFKIEIKNVNSFRFIKKAIEFDVQRQITLLEKGETPPQETRGFKESIGQTVSQRSKEAAHDYRYFPEPDIPPIQFTKEQIEQWRTELPVLPEDKRLEMIGAGITRSKASVIVLSPVRNNKYDELLRQHPSKYQAIADLVVNTPEDKVATLEFVEKVLNTDEEQIGITAKKVISENPKAVEDLKAGKQQAMFFLIGKIKNELGNVDVPTAQKIITHLVGNES